jgi:hypothetical protein
MEILLHRTARFLIENTWPGRNVAALPGRPLMMVVPAQRNAT